MDRWHIIGRGDAGWHAAGVNVTSSGGSIEAFAWWHDDHRVAPYQESAVDGAPIYDAQDADYAAFSHFVISGPMVDPRLDPDDWKPFRHNDPEPHALDYVGVERYIAMLRVAVAGVRFGRVRGGLISWETGLNSRVWTP
jgi:hypothetical protein